jgi:hypothetical protein
VFIPDVADTAAAWRVASRLRELRGDDFVGGFVLRRFERGQFVHHGPDQMACRLTFDGVVPVSAYGGCQPPWRCASPFAHSAITFQPIGAPATR